MPAPIGAVFTPLSYAQDTVIHTGLYANWRDGATILDPTAGSGNFIEAFLKIARENGDRISKENLKNLFAVEMQGKFIDEFHQKIKEEYQLDFPLKNFVHGDYLFTDMNVRADFLLGNPPWLNFCDLENHYKEKIKHFFLETGLAKNKKDLLLGSSRIDMAALIIVEAIRKNLKKGGEALFYLPLSLFLNDGAHNGFRSILQSGQFSLNYIHDYKKHPIFPNVSTRYGFASFTKGEKTEYPVSYGLLNSDNSLEEQQASPIGEPESPYLIHKKDEKWEIPSIEIKRENKPRQGLNTCGANTLFIFDSKEEQLNRLWIMKNKEMSALLPEDLIYPLIGADQFKSNKKNRYVFLPYRKDGRVMNQEELQKYPEAWNYLKENQKKLVGRKGVLIQNSVQKGFWWSLLGIGPYSFSPWKVVWEAYGKKEFKAEIFSSKSGKLWQPNQALQAFIPLSSKKDALEIKKKLNDPLVEKLLKDQGMEGTCNWAQPGRMMKFFKIKN